jgi:methyl-CpG-binding domain protein 4
VSPFGLLEEELWQDPWRLLLACLLLNKTSGKQVRLVLWDLLALCPTPAAAVTADTDAIRAIIQPLGLHNKRAVAVQKLSDDFMNKEWTCPTQLYGIGKYAADAYYIFCRGQWEGVQPDDKDLIKYHEWLRSTGGLGTGLTRAVHSSEQHVVDKTAELAAVAE